MLKYLWGKVHTIWDLPQNKPEDQKGRIADDVKVSHELVTVEAR